jgi:predicted AlkP superfamily phosphohydrolase/phosphomutase
MLRVLGSAAVAGFLLAADVVVLTLFLDPSARLLREAPALLAFLLVPYGVTAGLGLGVLGLLLHTLAPRQARPPVPGLPYLTLLTFVQATLAAALFWWNLVSYRHSIPVPFVHALTAAAVVVTLAAVALLGVGFDSLLFPERSRAGLAPVVVLAAAATVVGPLALRPDPEPPSRVVPVRVEPASPRRRVVLVGIDGLSPALLELGLRRGSLPAFEGLARRGAHGPLATLRPAEGPPVWTSIFTGRLPRDHGVKSFASYRLRGSGADWELLPKGILVRFAERIGLVTRLPVTARSRRSPALWEALNAFDVRAGVVRFWGTQPPERVQGFMISNHFHRLSREARGAEALFPPDLFEQVRDRVVQPADVDRALVAEFVDLSGDAEERRDWRRDLVERALAPDLTYQRAGSLLRAAYDPPFFATYFYGLDVVGHAFTREAWPERFGDVRPEEQRRFGRVIERYAAFLGQWVAELERGLRPREVLMVVSGYGMDPVPWWRRLLGISGEHAPSGSHEAAPDGVVFVVGDGVRRGAQLQRGSILDVTPTLLYLMGLPIARDMEGRVWTEILEEELLRQSPVSVIPSYAGVRKAEISEPVEEELPPLPEDTP